MSEKVNPLRLMSAVLRAAGFVKHEKLVLAVLVDRCDGAGVCWPSLPTLAAQTGISRRGVVRALASLRDRGLITWESRRGRSRSNRYALAIKALLDLPAVVKTGHGDTFSNKSGHGGTPIRDTATRSNVPLSHPKEHSRRNPQEGKQEEVCAEPKRLDADRAAGDPVLMTFPTKRKNVEWGLLESKALEWQSIYTWLDVLGACARARQWCIDNPAKRKTSRGMMGFLGSWLRRDVDNGKSRRPREWQTGDPLKADLTPQKSIRERDIESYTHNVREQSRKRAEEAEAERKAGTYKSDVPF